MTEAWKEIAARGLLYRHSQYVTDQLNISIDKLPNLAKLMDQGLEQLGPDEKQMYYDMVEIVEQCREKYEHTD